MSLFSENEMVETMQLERALGLTTQSNATLCTLPTGQLVYAVGCVAVLFDPELNQQKGLFKIDRAVSSLCCSPDGRYLAIGSRGADAHVYVYDIANGDELAELSGHKYGVGCMAFSPDSRLLVTCGFKVDKQMLCWNWRIGSNIYNKIGNRVHSTLFNTHGNYFVTCGDRHLKWWYFTKSDTGQVVEVHGFPASIMEAQRYSNFTDCTFGSGSNRHMLYCTTAGGGICIFQENRIMDKYIPLDCSSSCSLMLSASMLFVGCSDGQCSIYSLADMKYIGALPKPEKLSRSALPSLADEKKAYYPACYAIRMIPNSRNVAVVYADRSMVIWDTADLKRINVFRLLLSHRACIWDVHFLAAHSGSDLSSTPFPPNTFMTCSADASVRIWNIDPNMHRNSKTKIPYCKDVLKVIDTSLGNDDIIPAGTTADPRAYDVCSDIPDTEQPYRVQVVDSPRCMAVNPNCKEFACGDRTGKIKIFDMSNLDRIAEVVQAHDSEVLSLSYSPILAPSGQLSPKSRSPASVLLASGGRDSLVHVFETGLNGPSFGFRLISTLSLHDSAVSIVKFTPDGQKLISCGASDEKMVFSRVLTEGEVKSVVKLKSIPTTNGVVNGLALDATNKYAITSGQNKRLNIWNVKTGRQARSYFLDKAEGELYRSDIDPSGMYIVTCALDRIIRIFDFFSGDVITEVCGHSDAITGVKFSPDGRHILSIGGDGCILVWKVPPTLVAAMQDRLLELYSTAQQRLHTAKKEATRAFAEAPLPATDLDLGPIPPAPTQRKAAIASEFMPPPAPVSSNHSKGPSRWVSRVKAEEADGYELFGQKIAIPDNDVPATRVRNKFTLEVSNIDIALDGTANPASPGSMMANQYEDSDNVNVDEDLNGESEAEPKMPRAIKSLSPIKTVNKIGSVEDIDDAELTRASGQVESWHRSAVELEGWLEKQMSEESEKRVPGSVLMSSMSAAYYAKLKAGAVQTASPTEGIDTEDGFDPAEVFGDLAGNLSPTRSSGNGSSARSSGKSAHPDLEARSQKTAAAVGQMRDRLLAMGILNKDKPVSRSVPDQAPSSPVRNISARSLKLAAATNEHLSSSFNGALVDEAQLMPPAPPFSAEENSKKTAAAVNLMRNNLYEMGLIDRNDADGNGGDGDTDSTVSVGQGDDDEFNVALVHKTKQASQLLMELERVSREAAQAVHDLQVLRHSVACGSVSASKDKLMSPARKSTSDIRASPILMPSSSPSKGNSSRLNRSTDKNNGNSRSREIIDLLAADEVISHYKKCCSSMAASVSVSVFEEHTEYDGEFKVQHIIENDF